MADLDLSALDSLPAAQFTPATFAQAYQPVADKISAQTGIDSNTILGQMGLETGWGKSIIPGTNNLTNIKDFSGTGTSAVDNQTGTTDKYQTFNSLDDYANAYSGLLSRKYAGALNTGSDAQATAKALKAGGFAQDPNYVSKVTSAANMVAQARQGAGANLDALDALPDAPQQPGFWQSVGDSVSQAAQHPLDAVESFGGGAGRGVQQLALGGQNLLGRAISALGANGIGNWLQQDAVQGNTAGQQQAAALPNQGFSKAGEITGQALPALFVPGSIAAQGAVGASIGAADAAAQGQSGVDVLGNAVLGGAGGAAGAGIAKGIGGLIGGVGGADVQALRAIGVRPTIGQTIGGLANKVEQKATSAPLYGDAISAGRQGAVNQFNKGVVNEALSPIGADVGGAAAGTDAITAASKQLSDAWNTTLPQATFAADAPFMSSVQQARQGLAASGVPQPILDRFDSMVGNNLLGRVNQAGQASGVVYQPGESMLTQFVRNVNKNVASNADDRALSGAVQDVVNAARDSLQRNSGQQVADQLANIRQSYARFKTVESAAGSKAGGQTDSLFTPSAFNRAVKSAASQGQRARGQAFGQDLSEAGVNTLGGSVPDSGTAGRMAQAAGIGGLGAGAIANPLATLGYVGGAGLTHLLYSPGGRAITSALLSARPDLLRAIGGTIGNTANLSGGLLGSFGSNQ